jgi:Fe-S cluster biogenesis protein NfuA
MSEAKEKLIGRIEEAISQLRPYLEADGGDLSLVELTDDMIVKVKLHGACSSCSMSMMTLKAGVEEAVKRVAPEVRSVEAVQ